MKALITDFDYPDLELEQRLFAPPASNSGKRSAAPRSS